MSETGSDVCKPHAELLDTHRKKLERSTLGGLTSITSNDDDTRPDSRTDGQEAGTDQEDTDEVTSSTEQTELIRRLVDRVTELEHHARRLLLNHLDNGLARTLLVADRNRKSPPSPLFRCMEQDLMRC